MLGGHGLSRDAAEDSIAGLQTGGQIVGSVAGGFIKFQSTTDALRMSFPKAYGPGTILGGQAGSPPTRISGNKYWSNFESFAP